MARLRRADCSDPGIRRRRSGHGFAYIDPRVFDRFDGDLTVGGVIHRLPDDASEWPEVQAAIERGVLDLLDGREESRAVERIEPDAPDA